MGNKNHEWLAIGAILLVAVLGLAVVWNAPTQTLTRVVVPQVEVVKAPVVEEEVKVAAVDCYDSDAGYFNKKIIPGYVKVKYADNTVEYFPDEISEDGIDEASCNGKELAYTHEKCASGTTVKTNLAGVPDKVVAASCVKEKK